MSVAFSVRVAGCCSFYAQIWLPNDIFPQSAGDGVSFPVRLSDSFCCGPDFVLNGSKSPVECYGRMLENFFSLSFRAPLMDWEPCQGDRQGSAGR